MKVVLDTNVLISALISPHNPPDLILQSRLAGDFELLTSEEQLEEIRRVSRYAHLQPYLQPHRAREGRPAHPLLLRQTDGDPGLTRSLPGPLS